MSHECDNRIVDLAHVPPVSCPCGWSRRAFLADPRSPVSLHRVEIAIDARAHFHKRLTEIYYILECDREAVIELDGERVPIRPGSAVLIPPGTRHRALGRMTVLVVSSPPFDPADEWEDDTTPAAHAGSCETPS